MRRVLAAGLAGLMVAITLPSLALAQGDQEAYDQLDLFGRILEEIRDEYVDEVSTTELIDAAIEGMIGSLDPHSKYHNPKSYKEVQVQARGEFGGLGIEVTMENGLVKVIAPIDDTPAQRAGIESGDLVTHLDDEPRARAHAAAGGRQDAGPRQLPDHADDPSQRGRRSHGPDHPGHHQDPFGARTGGGRRHRPGADIHVLRAHLRRPGRRAGRLVGGAGRPSGRRRARPAQQSGAAFSIRRSRSPMPS